MRQFLRMYSCISARIQCTAEADQAHADRQSRSSLIAFIDRCCLPGSGRPLAERVAAVTAGDVRDGAGAKRSSCGSEVVLVAQAAGGRCSSSTERAPGSGAPAPMWPSSERARGMGRLLATSVVDIGFLAHGGDFPAVGISTAGPQIVPHRSVHGTRGRCSSVDMGRIGPGARARW